MDPAEEQGGLNLVVAMGNAPLGRVDILGLVPELTDNETRSDQDILEPLEKKAKNEVDALQRRDPRWCCYLVTDEVRTLGIEKVRLGWRPISAWTAVGASAIAASGPAPYGSGVSVVRYSRQILVAAQLVSRYEAVVRYGCFRGTEWSTLLGPDSIEILESEALQRGVGSATTEEQMQQGWGSLASKRLTNPPLDTAGAGVSRRARGAERRESGRPSSGRGATRRGHASGDRRCG